MMAFSKWERINIQRPKQLLNGNSFILGVSGGGKSFAAKGEIINQVLSSDADIIIIDPEREYSQLVNAMGGEVINISATSDNHINAMDMNKDYGDGANPVILKSEFIMSLCEQLIGGTNLGAKQKSIIDRCTASVYRSYQQNDYQGHIPTLQDFRAELLQQDEPEAKELALAIELFTHGSLNTFAKQTNVDTNNRLICYDILDLGKQLMPIGMLVVLDSILNRITQNRAKGSGGFDMSNSLAAVHPELIAEWSEKNLPLTPDSITFGSNKKVWWKGACGHEWETSVKARSNGEKCPICSGARVVAGINDLSTLKPELASEWSEENEIKPTEVSIGSHKKVIWKCKLGHEWIATVKSRTINGTGCPYCSRAPEAV